MCVASGVFIFYFIFLPDIFPESFNKLHINVSLQQCSTYFLKHSTKDLSLKK